MSEQPKLKKVIWAVDAVHECTEIEMRCLEAISALTSNADAVVEPVYVIPPQRFTAPFEVVYPPFQLYSEQAIDGFKERMKAISNPKLNPPMILDKPVMSTVGAVNELSHFAEERHADLIVVGTHCRKGASRLFLGSFAESLLLYSRTPLLMVGMHTTQIKNFDSIFFPTDFGTTSEKVFPRVIDLAKSLNAKLYIYHMIEKTPIYPVGFLPPSNWVNILEQDRQEARKQLETYFKLAKDAGLNAEAIFDESNTSESEAIIAAAQSKNSSLIAMAAQSGAIVSTIVGSTTRQVVRSATCPVWVLHEHGLAQSMTFDVTEDDVMSDLTEHGRERKQA